MKTGGGLRSLSRSISICRGSEPSSCTISISLSGLILLVPLDKLASIGPRQESWLSFRNWATPCSLHGEPTYPPLTLSVLVSTVKERVTSHWAISMTRPETLYDFVWQDLRLLLTVLRQHLVIRCHTKVGRETAANLVLSFGNSSSSNQI